MSTNKIGFNNFKAFGEKMQTFSKKPITLVYGPNSIGKSSLLHMMAYKEEIFKSHFSPNKIKYGDTISLNGFSSFVHKKELSRTIHWEKESEQFGIDVEIGTVDKNNQVVPLSIKYTIEKKLLVELKYVENEKYEIVVNLEHPKIEQIINRIENNESWDKSKIFEALGDHNEISQIVNKNDFLFIDDRYFMGTKEGAFEERDRLIFNTWSPKDEGMHSILGKNLAIGEFSPNPYANLAETAEIMKKVIMMAEKEFPTETSVRFPYKVFCFDDNTVLSLKMFIAQFALEVTFDINAQLKTNSFYYIGPLRFYPERNTRLEEFKSDTNIDSEDFWVLLQKSDEIREKMNIWLSSDKLNTPYEIVLHKKYDLTNLLIKNKEDFTREEIEKSLSEDVLLFKDQRSNTLVHNRDMGLGVTQIMPIIGMSLLLKGHTIAIEQPELHLHPRIQAEIADEFIRSCKENENEFIIETHSEHLLLRIMKRMRHTYEDRVEVEEGAYPLTPDDVCLLYVDSHKGNTFIRELELDKDGSLKSRWPSGFFEESYNEMFS